MGYFSKETLLASYKTLSTINVTKDQGLTQKVSALKYLCALDSFYKQHSKNCDVSITVNRDLFSLSVGEIVKLNDEICTKDFYLNTGDNGRDFDCGSNFYSQSSVKESKVNPAIEIPYPKRSHWLPVMTVKNQVLIYQQKLIPDAIAYYLPLKEHRLAFIIWLLRFKDIAELKADTLRDVILRQYSEELVNSLFSDDITDYDLSLYNLNTSVADITQKDIYTLFVSGNEVKYIQQQIFYGAPGTGKSHTINEITKGKPKSNVFRTTFHPDSDYSTFVGAYKPTISRLPITDEKGQVMNIGSTTLYKEQITYKFVPQAFLKAYIRAWNVPEEKVFLVIEEINRGNCAQIFGDLFQLLDRKNGQSEYPIKADDDICRFLKEGKDDNGNDILMNKDGIADDELCLPDNLYIWATMNTSDQSLFPIDSAFKRRWDWEYVRIAEGRDKDTNKPLCYSFTVNGTDYDWWSFLLKINEHIGSITSSEDKKLGYFFCQAEDGHISAEKFVSKVCFYLWNDVFKSFGFGRDKAMASAFKKDGGKDITFDDFYTENETTHEQTVNQELLEQFIKKLGVETVEERKRKESQAANDRLQ